jgi:hypothetical protein
MPSKTAQSLPVGSQFRQCRAERSPQGSDSSGDHDLDRGTAGQVYLKVAQRLRGKQRGDAGDQRAGGMRLAATELAEQVPLGAHDIYVVRLSMLKHSLGEFGE